MIITKNILLNILFAGVVLLLTRQIPLSDYSIFGNICLLGLFFVSYFFEKKYKTQLHIIFVIFLWLVLLLFYSVIVEQNQVNFALRFFVILLFLLITHWIKVPFSSIKIFYIFIILQSVFLIVMELIMLLLFNQSTYLPVRFYFQDQGWGDVYTYDGFFYRVQVKGNSLIPFALFITFLKEFPLQYRRGVQMVLFTASIIAGNFAFLISIGCFFTMYYLFSDLRKKKFVSKIIFLLSLSLIAGSTIITYIEDTLSRKQDVSLGTRKDQVEILLLDMQKNIRTFFFGRGLGNTVDVKTSYRNYTENVYFELQIIYFLNQLGLINFTLLIMLMILFSVRKIRDADLLFIYFCYITYALTNPYILDTTQIVVILILLSIKNERNKRENRMYNCALQS